MRWRGVIADDLAIRAKANGRKFALPLTGFYKTWCRLGCHFLHHSFMADMWVCACRRNFIYNEEIVP